MTLDRHDFGTRNKMRSDFRRGKEADFNRMMELEGLKQSGATKRTNLANEAGYRRQGLMNAGSLERTKLSNTGSLDVAKTRAGESGRQFDMSHSLNRKRNLFDMGNENRKFALNREKETFDQFDAINDMGMDALGGKSTSSFGDRMNRWNTFRENSGGLTKKTIDFAITKKLSDAKANGLSIKDINFTDTERKSFFSGTNGGGVGAGQRESSGLDWIEGEDGRRRHFNQQGSEVAFSPPPGRAGLSGFPKQLRTAHSSNAWATPPSASPASTLKPMNEKRWPSPVKSRMAHFRQTIKKAEDDTGFKEWIHSGPDYSRKAMLDRMRNKKTPDYRRY